MQRLPIYRGTERNSRVFRGKTLEHAFSVSTSDWELYLEKFFTGSDTDEESFTEEEWRNILRSVTIEKENLRSFYRNMTGMDHVGESFSEMRRYDMRTKETETTFPGTAAMLSRIIVFYERFILFASDLIPSDRRTLVLSRAA